MFNILKFIINHPLNHHDKLGAVLRFVKWQVASRLMPFPIVYQFTENSKLLIERGMTGATGNLYCGLHEFNDMGFLLHFLRPDDLFVDIGANVGSYTILAAAESGTSVISVEPVPSTFKRLESNILVNNIIKKVSLFNIGLGSEPGKVRFTRSLDTVNHVATVDETDVIDIQVDTLDHLIGLQSPALIKIDVEGYETSVLNGAAETLKKGSLKALIIELNGSGKRYGYEDSDIHDTLTAHGFAPYHYNPLNREMTPLNGFSENNTLYLRDISFVKARIAEAKKYTVNNVSF